MWLLEMLADRFGVFEALAYSTIKLNRCATADELSMDPRVADTVLEFSDDLRTAPRRVRRLDRHQNLPNPVEPSRRRANRPITNSRRTAAGGEVRDPAGELVCLTVYWKGALEVVRRLDGGERKAA